MDCESEVLAVRRIFIMPTSTPLDTLLDALITITNQLIHTSTVALDSTINSHTSLLSTYSRLESLVDRSIQTHQLELNLKLDSIQQHPLNKPPIVCSPDYYQLNRSFLKSLLLKNLPPTSPDHSLNTEKKVRQQRQKLKQHQVIITKPSLLLPSHSIQPSPPKSNTPLNHSIAPSATSSEPQTSLETAASPVDTLPKSNHDSRSNSDSTLTNHSTKPARIIRPSSSTILSSPIRIEEKTSSSLTLPSLSIRIPPSTLGHPDPPTALSPSNLIQIHPPKSASILVQILSNVDPHLHRHQVGSRTHHSTSPSSSDTTCIISPSQILHQSSFPLGSLKQIDLDFQLVHSYFNTP